jgi:hypothetical protein
MPATVNLKKNKKAQIQPLSGLDLGLHAAATVGAVLAAVEVDRGLLPPGSVAKGARR